MPIKPIDRLLFTQGGKCFFCDSKLDKSDASIEHLVAQANGGTNVDANCVVCCKAINRLLADMPLKSKIQIILNQQGNFVCPNGHSTTPPEKSPASAASATQDQTVSKPAASLLAANPPAEKSVNDFQVILNDLKKRGASKPRKVETLTNTIRSVLIAAKAPHQKEHVDAIFKHLQNHG